MLAVAIAPRTAAPGQAPSFAEVRSIIDARCVTCHSAAPTQPGFSTAPKDVALETPLGIRTHLSAIAQQAVLTRAMPLGNVTGMTDAERAKLGAWIDAGGPER